MFQFNFQKISQVPLTFFHKKGEISNYLKKIKNILKEKNYKFPESFLLLPTEKPIFLKKIPKNLKLIIVVGIGGSSLGTEAVYKALKRKKADLVEIFFLDTLNPLSFSELISKLKLAPLKRDEIAVCLVSKTGKTFETIANFFVLLRVLKRYQPKIFVITNEGSILWDFAKKRNYSILSIPKEVSGRYSVLSNVGIFPLALAGVDPKELLAGAKEVNKICLIANPLKNPALASALIIFYHYKEGKNIYSNFVFPPDLEFFGRWYCQLMAESLGKDKKGITPTVTVGTTDFHSLAQLYFDGPRDKLINFVFVKNLNHDFQIPPNRDLDFLFPGSEGKKIWELTLAIFEGVKKAYIKKKLPFTETILPELDERSLGALFQMKMIEIIFLAKLMRVNAFDQPGVELYKKETRKILRK